MWLRAVLLALLAVQPAVGRTILVGEGGVPTLAAAMVAAKDGDTVHLGAGSYFECAVVVQSDLVLEGAGEGTVLTDRMCDGKAALVVRGDRVTVRDLVLARARVPDRNGAGIRLEGLGLTVERVRFENDEVGLLAGVGGGSIVVRECVFAGGGVGGERPGAALMVGEVARLRVERSVFEGVRGNQVSTSAVRSELVGNRMSVGGEPGDGAAVLADGALLMEDNLLVVGPSRVPHDAAVVATGDAAVLRRNRLENGTGHGMSMLLDWTHGTPVLEEDVVGPGDAVATDSGMWRHRAGGAARATYGEARHTAGSVLRGLGGLFGR